MISNKKLLIIAFAKEKNKKEKGKGQHMDSCIYEPVVLYKLWLHKLVACWYIIMKNNNEDNAYCGYCCTKQSSK